MRKLIAIAAVAASLLMTPTAVPAKDPPFKTYSLLRCKLNGAFVSGDAANWFEITNTGPMTLRTPTLYSVGYGTMVLIPNGKAFFNETGHTYLRFPNPLGPGATEKADAGRPQPSANVCRATAIFFSDSPPLR
jgi:hypothetical protein